MGLPYLALLLLLMIGKYVANSVDDEITIEVEENEYESPQVGDSSKVYLAEHFDNLNDFEQTWVKSQAKKEGMEEDLAKYDGVWSVEPPQKDNFKGDLGLVLKSKAKHAAISSRLKRPFVFNNKPFIVQYEVLFQDGQECGGAYLKLLSETSETKNLEKFHDKTPYSIMFGPDKCGTDYKLHFIFRHKNPKNGSIEEKHCQKPKERLEEIFSDKLPHLYTLILNPDNTFEVRLDKKIINSGSLLEDFTPPVNPPQEIEDPDDKKPDGWDEREKIPDPNAVKPDDWDEDAPAQIVDESAVMPSGWLENEPTHLPDLSVEKPADWDTEMDGDWEPPMVENPACTNAPGCGPWEPPLINNPEFKGKWRAPLIDNPNYKGKWRPRKIPNPNYFEDKEPFKMQTVNAIGFEIWSMSKDILFDNIIITEDIVIAEEWASSTFDKKRKKIASDSESVVQKVANLTNEYPILWALYIIVLSIPVVFILYICCKSPSKTQEPQDLDEASIKKKTDETTEDVNDENKEENNDEEGEKISESDSDGDHEESLENEPSSEVEGTRKRKVK